MKIRTICIVAGVVLGLVGAVYGYREYKETRRPSEDEVIAWVKKSSMFPAIPGPFTFRKTTLIEVIKYDQGVSLGLDDGFLKAPMILLLQKTPKRKAWFARVAVSGSYTSMMGQRGDFDQECWFLVCKDKKNATFVTVNGQDEEQAEE